MIRKPKRGNATHGSNPPPGLKRRLSLARGALFWERLWPALWPVFGVAGGFLALALLDILPQLPGWLHAGVLLGVVVAFGIVLWRAVKALLGLPPKDAARRRLEVDSGALAQLCEPEIRERVVSRLRELGFRYVTLDLEGFRSGSFQQLVPTEQLLAHTEHLRTDGRP